MVGSGHESEAQLRGTVRPRDAHSAPAFNAKENPQASDDHPPEENSP
jgi:hypothetical protein